MAPLNQQEIARQLNLSQTTVSRALANHPSIKAETKAMVWHLAAQVGYQAPPSRSRSANSSSDPFIIGVLISIPARERGHGETSQLVLRGVTERSTREVVTIDVFYHEPTESNVRAIQRRIRQGRWRGALLVYPMGHDLVESIAKTIPCVSVVENYRKTLVDSVDVDQVEAISMLVSRLHAKGHRRIGFLSWVYDVPTPWVYHRFGAYVESLFRLGLEFDPARVFNIRSEEVMSPEEVADRVAGCVESGTTAFLCAADHQGYRLQELLRDRGIRVPRDLSLTGFDGIAPPSGQKQLATVRVPYDELGRSAFHQLLRRVENPTAPRRHVMVDGTFLEGKTIAAVTPS